MSYFGNVSSFPCLEFTAAFSRNQALFDARNDFPLFPQSTASHFGHFAETFPISPGIPAMRTRPSRKTACQWEPVHIDVAPSGDSLRSQFVSPGLPLWGSWRRSRLRGKNHPLRLRHLSQRERQGPHPSRLRRAGVVSLSAPMGQHSQNIQRHCEPVTDVTGVAIPRIGVKSKIS